MPKNSKILLFKTSAELARAAAGIFRDSCKSAVALRGLFTVALSGGKTPAALYSTLASPPFKDAVPWKNAHLFWGDERRCSPDDKDSNYRAAFVNLISKIAIPMDNVHRIQGELDPVTAASIYEEELKAFFGSAACPVFDLVLLGLGADGHTLSVFPSLAAHGKQERLVTANKDPAGLWRVSMTLKMVNNASKAVFLVSGAKKARILKDVLDGKGGFPATHVDLANGELIWMADKEAAGLL
ncbi:MAG: 6-phosphogluconolactonase [Deltaproteobacteria bacterium]|nr:6-phosphogluconolactonase [Deltaproteobacteria bacterium]